MNVVIDGKCWHSHRSNQAQSEGEGIMEAAKILNGQLHGYQRWRTAEVILTDRNCADPDVRAHAGWPKTHVWVCGSSTSAPNNQRPTRRALINSTLSYRIFGGTMNTNQQSNTNPAQPNMTEVNETFNEAIQTLVFWLADNQAPKTIINLANGAGVLALGLIENGQPDGISDEVSKDLPDFLTSTKGALEELATA
jgi:hypothetical protein